MGSSGGGILTIPKSRLKAIRGRVFAIEVLRVCNDLPEEKMILDFRLIFFSHIAMLKFIYLFFFCFSLIYYLKKALFVTYSHSEMIVQLFIHFIYIYVDKHKTKMFSVQMFLLEAALKSDRGSSSLTAAGRTVPCWDSSLSSWLWSRTTCCKLSAGQEAQGGWFSAETPPSAELVCPVQCWSQSRSG